MILYSIHGPNNADPADQSDEIEKSVSRAFSRRSGEDCPPPFGRIVSAIEEGQPAESFEEFFGRETASHAGGTKKHAFPFTAKTVAAMAAAALLVCIAGGAAVGVILNSMTLGSSKSDSAACTECRAEENAVDYDELSDTPPVSDSDTRQTEDNDSDAQSEG